MEGALHPARPGVVGRFDMAAGGFGQAAGLRAAGDPFFQGRAACVQETVGRGWGKGLGPAGFEDSGEALLGLVLGGVLAVQPRDKSFQAGLAPNWDQSVGDYSYRAMPPPWW